MRKLFDAHRQIRRYGLEGARHRAKTKLERNCIDAAQLVSQSDINHDDVGYATLAAMCLPHKSLDKSACPDRWSRAVDNFSVVLESGVDDEGVPVGIPYGSKARLILLYLTTQSIQARQPSVDWASSMYAWLQAMRHPPGGGMTNKLFMRQAWRISSLIMHWRIDDGEYAIRLSGRGINEVEQSADSGSGIGLPFSRYQAEGRFPEKIGFDPGFWQLAKKQYCPIRLTALGKIANNSAAIDLYIWLAHRLPELKASTVWTWKEVVAQFGPHYRNSRQMISNFIDVLSLVLAVYPEAHIRISATGLMLSPSAGPVADG
ncbi:MAG: hypothetical protein CMK32_03175 [Porticoccaceae bacterium]|nr:hypothetical protein [Porticoccaceae bacterium]